MDALTPARVEGWILHRTIRYWPLGAILLWASLTGLQEPNLFRREGIPFYWAAIEVVVLGAWLCLPALFATTAGPASWPWALRIAIRPTRVLLARVVGISLYGGVVSIAALFLCTVVSWVAGHPGFHEPTVIALQVLALGPPAAMVAVGLSSLCQSRGTLLASWGLCLIGSLGLGLPVPVGGLFVLSRAAAFPEGSAFVALYLSTGAGLLLVTTIRRRIGGH